jgi:hypothetical protein
VVAFQTPILELRKDPSLAIMGSRLKNAQLKKLHILTCQTWGVTNVLKNLYFLRRKIAPIPNQITELLTKKNVAETPFKKLTLRRGDAGTQRKLRICYLKQSPLKLTDKANPQLK